MIKLLLLAALSAHAADDYKVVEPRSYDGKPAEFRMFMYDVPPGATARFQVSLTKEGGCYDTSFINWTKGEADGKKIHGIQFDAWETPWSGKRPEGCERRKTKNRDGIYGGLHTVDIPAEKKGSKVFITYRAGTEVRVALNHGP